MASFDPTRAPLMAANRPLDAGSDPFSEWFLQRSPGVVAARDGDSFARPGWEGPDASDPSSGSVHGWGEHSAGQPMAHALDLDAVARSLSALKLAHIDMPDVSGPGLATFGASEPEVLQPQVIGAAARTAFDAAAGSPVAARGASNTAAAPEAAPLVAPQVLASGTWLGNPQFTLKTNFGDVIIELYPNAAPVTVANALAYVSSGFYDGLLFHRVIPGFVAQGGGFATGQAYQAPPYAPIVLESNNGLFNDRGTIAMARTDAANSATSQFFINLVDNDFLNYSASAPGYAVFGKVVTGLSVVDAIAAVGTPSGTPTTEVKILEADQTKQGTLHSTSGRVDLGVLAADVVWTGAPELRFQYSLDAGAHWTLGAGRSFTAPQGAYEAGAIKVRYMDALGSVGASNGTGGNMIVDTRAIKAGDGNANTLTGTSAADVMYALGGHDTLDGGSGNDSMMGGSGNDTYTVQSAGDQAVEAAGAGTDRVNAGVTFSFTPSPTSFT